MARLTRTMSRTGIPSVIATARSSPASAHSRMASAANGGGTKIADTDGARGGGGLPDGVEDRDPVGPVLEDLAALARG